MTTDGLSLVGSNYNAWSIVIEDGDRNLGQAVWDTRYTLTSFPGESVQCKLTLDGEKAIAEFGRDDPRKGSKLVKIGAKIHAINGQLGPAQN